MSLPAAAGVQERIDAIENSILLDWTPVSRSLTSSTLQERMGFHMVPGASVAVINEGRVEWARGFGIKEGGKPGPVTVDTIFQVGSISKPVTAMAALRLVQEGRLDLDGDVNRYLVSWKVPANGDWQPKVTLRQLLSHSAGTTVHGFLGYSRNERIPTLVQVLTGEPPNNSGPVYVELIPGTQFRYSGGGTSIVQQILVDVTGQQFPELMRELVLGPLEMAHSTFEQPLPESKWENAATGHYWVSNEPVEGKWRVYPEMGAAGLWSTASDMAHFAVEIQQAVTADRGKVLSRETATQMLAPQVTGKTGLGPFLEGEGDGARFGHAGDDHGFVGELTAYRNRGQGLVVLTNAYSGTPLIEDIKRTIAHLYGWPDFKRKNPVRSRSQTKEPDAFRGPYEMSNGQTWDITAGDGYIQLQVPGQPPIPLYPAPDGSFATSAVNATLTFTRDDENNVLGLSLTQSGEEITGSKR